MHQIFFSYFFVAAHLDVLDSPQTIRGIVDVRPEVAPKIRLSIPCSRHHEELVIHRKVTDALQSITHTQKKKKKKKSE